MDVTKQSDSKLRQKTYPESVLDLSEDINLNFSFGGYSGRDEVRLESEEKRKRARKADISVFRHRESLPSLKAAVDGGQTSSINAALDKSVQIELINQSFLHSQLKGT